ncbi:MAG: hypothetical protein BYD32DRAFT_422022 [Podila humilis]|nr:MAG: hypothetical protein BYD32DRAFT_422022 [Podila humilis]
MGCGTETWTPAILLETDGDIESQSPSATSELSDDTGTETPGSMSDGTGTQTPVSAPDLSDDTETQTGRPKPHGPQDVMAQRPPAKSQGVQDALERTSITAPNVAGDIAMLKPITESMDKDKVKSGKPKASFWSYCCGGGRGK